MIFKNKYFYLVLINITCIVICTIGIIELGVNVFLILGIVFSLIALIPNIISTNKLKSNK